MSLAPGQRLGPYEISAKLGEGGMGEVYRATDSRLKRDVAIKVLPAAFTEDKERLARFEREAQLLAQLHHPNIASIFGLEESEGTRALVMELVEGPTLAERLEAGPLPFNESLSISLQIAHALEEAHEKGIVHRDLKPQNIKASIEGKVKVLDFGLAKAMDPLGGVPATASQLAHSPTLTLGGTAMGTILGTAAYMSPEQAKGQAVDKRADIWAFGVVLFEMLSGQRLFAGETAPETLAEVLKTAIDLGKLPESTPMAIRQLVGRCLERNPRNRLHDIADARIVLDDVIRDGGAIEVARAVATPPRGATRRERAAWLVAAALAVIAGVAVAAGVVAWKAASAPPERPRFERLTFAPQFISNARFAPDGRTIVLSAAREGNTSELFVRYPQDPQPRAVGKPDVQLLAVSSKGELALLTHARLESHRTYRGTLARTPLGEASPREVLNDVTAADWTPDGSELAIIRQVEGKSRLELPIGKILAESTGYLSDARVSPRGDRIAYMPHASSGDNRGHVVVIDRTGAVVATSPEYWGEEGLAWTADGEEVLFSASEGGPEYAIRALAMDGAVREVVSAPTGLIVHDVSASGRLLVSTHLERSTVFARLAGASGERELPWLDQSVSSVVSRDGRSLIFGDQSQLSGSLYSVLFRAADGSPPVRLGDGEGRDISPDGAAVLAVVMDEPPRLMIYPTGAGEPRDISGAGFVAYDRQSPRFLPDGKSVVFCGTEAGKASRCYLRDLAGSAARAITPEGTGRLTVSADGTTALAQGADGRYRRYLLDPSHPVAGGEGAAVPGLDRRDTVIAWGMNDRSILVYRDSEIPARVDRLDLVTGQRTLFRELAPADRVGVYGIGSVSFSNDERSYAYEVGHLVGTLFAVEGVR